MATPQGAQPPPPPTAYDRDDHLIGVLAGALRAQTDAVVERLDGVTTELRSTRDALVADSRAGRRIVVLAIVVVAALAGVSVRYGPIAADRVSAPVEASP